MGRILSFIAIYLFRNKQQKYYAIINDIATTSEIKEKLQSYKAPKRKKKKKKKEKD
jgi:hypothetical protein